MFDIANFKQRFQEHYGENPVLLVKSPGRINLIGEHTDYNEGYVLPAAIDKYIYVALSSRDDTEIHLYSASYQKSFATLTTKNDLSDAPEWAKYILGVVQQIQARGRHINGFNISVDGDVPLGAGLSSSAALTCAVGYALDNLFSLGLSRQDIALIGQQTEHEAIGLKCGIMDQFASVMGRAQHAIQLDCRNLRYDYIPLQWGEYELLLLNTNVKHSLATSAYNDRRAACEQGVSWVQEAYPEVQSLRDVTLQQLMVYVQPKSEDVFTKCLFVIKENQRLLDACQALLRKDIERFGELLFEAHWALSREYEVSCAELDFLVSAAQEHPDVIGARMMGGGFGGCTINLVKKGRSADFIQQVAPQYETQFGHAFTPIDIAIGEGSSLVTSGEA